MMVSLQVNRVEEGAGRALLSIGHVLVLDTLLVCSVYQNDLRMNTYCLSLLASTNSAFKI